MSLLNPIGASFVRKNLNDRRVRTVEHLGQTRDVIARSIFRRSSSHSHGPSSHKRITSLDGDLRNYKSSFII